MKFIKIALFLSIIQFSIPVFSHYQWIITDYNNTDGENRIKLHICCGHKFPESELLLKREMITCVDIIDAGIKKPIQISVNGKTWEGKTELNENSGNIVVYSLKKKISKSPYFWGRTMIFPDRYSGKGFEPVTGEGLEIIPEDLFNKKQSDHLRIRILLDGKPVRSKLVVIPDGKKSRYLNPGPDNSMVFKLKYQGLYLLNTYYKGKGASLTFSIRN